MALKKDNNTPAFETEEDTNVNTATETVQEAPAATAQDKAKVEATTAIAKAQTTAVGAVKKGFSAALQELENQLEIDHVKALGVGTLPKLTADRAGFEMGEGKDQKTFGDYVDFEIYSFNKRWLITAGVDGEEGKEMLRTSYDGETLENEAMGAKEYLGYLKEQGYGKADMRLYYDAWGFIVNSEKLGEVDEADREMVQLQLSPSSVKQFTAYQIQAGIKASMTKKEVSNIVRATIERKEFGGNKYASIKFSAA